MTLLWIQHAVIWQSIHLAFHNTCCSAFSSGFSEGKHLSGFQHKWSLTFSLALLHWWKVWSAFFRRSKLMHAVMDYWKTAWGWFYEGFDMNGWTCFFFSCFFSFRDSNSAPNAGDTKAFDTIAVLKVNSIMILSYFGKFLRPENVKAKIFLIYI